MTYMDYIGELCERFSYDQTHMARDLVLKNSFEPGSLRTAAGVDLAYWNKDDREWTVCCIVVIDIETHEVLEKQYYSSEVSVPYIPGFLAFREVPYFKHAWEKLNIKPDIFFFDGNGYLHPRHMGVASQASIVMGTDTPTVGIAKSYYHIDGAEYIEPAKTAGSYTDIEAYGTVYGRALRTHDDVRQVFVSPGNHITLDTATELALKLTDKESHIPIPTRLADLETHIMRQKLEGHEDELADKE